ncbi:DUF3726 domain-containing protein [Pararhizobium sp.]|uniref:DUF3726 domain-containing protein n=1 Tax=Pararhizobium sp. TaxID=1977563 RepID=UPI003D105077
MNTVELSLNEVEMTTRKAALGAGLTLGVAEEIGRAARWLSARGYDGLAEAVRFLTSGEQSSPDNAASVVAVLFDLDRLLSSPLRQAVCTDGLSSMPLFYGLCGAMADVVHADIVIEAGDEIFSTAEVRLLPGFLGNIRIQMRPKATAARAIECRPPPTTEAVLTAAAALCARTYVPASQQSRIRGAGAAKTDND